MTIASTIVEVVEACDIRLSFIPCNSASRSKTSSFKGQLICSANLSVDALGGLRRLSSTLSRRLGDLVGGALTSTPSVGESCGGCESIRGRLYGLFLDIIG